VKAVECKNREDFVDDLQGKSDEVKVYPGVELRRLARCVRHVESCHVLHRGIAKKHGTIPA
jgi:hypothetical protein